MTNGLLARATRQGIAAATVLPAARFRSGGTADDLSKECLR